MKKVFKVFSICLMLVLVLAGCSKKSPTDKVLIAGADSNFSDYLLDAEKVGIQYTPTFVFYKDGKLQFFNDGESDVQSFTELYNNAQKSKEELAKIYGVTAEDAIKYSNQGNSIYTEKLTDLNGNTFKLSDFEGLVCIEVVQTACSHCVTQLTEYSDDIYAAFPDITFIVYFIDADAAQVQSFLDTLK